MHVEKKTRALFFDTIFLGSFPSISHSVSDPFEKVCTLQTGICRVSFPTMRAGAYLALIFLFSSAPFIGVKGVLRFLGGIPVYRTSHLKKAE